MNIHDALALGEYEAAIPTQQQPPQTKEDAKNVEEVHRLPLLLRLLSASRPLASLPDVKEWVKDDEEEDGSKHDNDAHEEDDNDDDDEKDDWLDSIVQRLEDRAALYSAAEGLEVLAGYLAPHVCKKWSKLAPPHRTTDSGGSTAVVVHYDTAALEQAARNVGRRRKLSETSLGAFSDEGNVLDDYNRIDAYDEDDDNEEGDDEPREDTSTLSDVHRRKRRKQSSSQLLGRKSSGGSEPPAMVIRRQSTATLADREFAAEDSQQALATKSWTELALLVSQSLQQPLRTSPLCLTVDEASILAQSQSSTQTRGLISADLSATLAALLHHTPVLRYDHVAVRRRVLQSFVVFSALIMCLSHSLLFHSHLVFRLLSVA